MKQVPLLDSVHDDLKEIVSYRKKLYPLETITFKSVVAKLINNEAKRIKRKEVK